MFSMKRLPSASTRLPHRLVAIFLFAAAVLAGCEHVEEKPLTIGVNAWPGYEFLFLAKEKGFFAQEGVEVRFVEYSSLGDARRDFERGHLDGMASTLVEVLQAKHLSNRSPEVVLVAGISDGADIVVAKQEISSIAELEGKRVGVEPATLNEFVLARALQKAGLNLPDVKRIPLDQAAMAKAFAAGEIDAVVTYPPHSLGLVARPDARLLFGSHEIPGEVVDVIAFDSAVLRERTKEIGAILRVWGRAITFAESNQADAYSIMAAREGLGPGEFGDALRGLHPVGLEEQARYFGDSSPLAGLLKLVEETLRSGGALSGASHSGCCLTAARILYDQKSSGH